MVYCNLLKVQDNIIKYSIGGYVSDITGVLVIDLLNKSFFIEKDPAKSKIYPQHIGSMIRKHLHEFEQGNFPEKMSYEI